MEHKKAVFRTKGAFTWDLALLKLTYLATRNIEKKWAMPLQNPEQHNVAVERYFW